jgi:flagellar motor switch protein FliN
MTLTAEPSVRHGNGAGNGAPASATRQNLIESVDVDVETYLGATSMTIADLNGLMPGSVVTLNAGLNALVELRVNGVPIGQGELVAVGDKFGVRLVSVSP